MNQQLWSVWPRSLSLRLDQKKAQVVQVTPESAHGINIFLSVFFLLTYLNISVCFFCHRKDMGRWMLHLLSGLGLLVVLSTYCHAEGEDHI